MRIFPLSLAVLLLSCSAVTTPDVAPPPAGPTGRTTVVEGIMFVEIHRPGSPALWISRTEVTNAQYERSGLALSRCAHSTADDGPVVHAKYKDAVRFCDRLTEEFPGTFRLPTDEEWEFACRADTTTRYFFGDDASKLREYAWVGEEIWDPDASAPGLNPSAGAFFTDGTGGPESDGYWLWYEKETSSVAHPVGTLLPNSWGLYDMLGNAAEWCLDTSGQPVDLVETVFSTSIISGRREWCTPGEGHVVCGGSYARLSGSDPDPFACSSRCLRDGDWGAGFRVVRIQERCGSGD